MDIFQTQRQAFIELASSIERAYNFLPEDYGKVPIIVREHFPFFFIPKRYLLFADDDIRFLSDNIRLEIRKWLLIDFKEFSITQYVLLCMEYEKTRIGKIRTGYSSIDGLASSEPASELTRVGSQLFVTAELCLPPANYRIPSSLLESDDISIYEHFDSIFPQASKHVINDSDIENLKSKFQSELNCLFPLLEELRRECQA